MKHVHILIQSHATIFILILYCFNPVFRNVELQKNTIKSNKSVHPLILFLFLSRVVELWKNTAPSSKASSSLANPSEYENLFSMYPQSVKTEQFLLKERQTTLNACKYSVIEVCNRIKRDDYIMILIYDSISLLFTNLC